MSAAHAVGWIAFAVGLPVYYFVTVAVLRGSAEALRRAFGYGAASNWIGFVAGVLDGDRASIICGLLAVWFTWEWWRRRRGGRGREVLRELGAKSRARIEAMVRQMSPSPIPSPAGG
ncbi:hypothetical protein [Actinomadura formosensis]|uniref:hypothetical protein n=1 Tax=Actinomadura formosensis TaxID=60706 RepID=UPI003D91B23E